MTIDALYITDWHGCYDDSWKGIIAEETFAHPAKFAYGLITRIIDHGLRQGYWKPGDLIGDPFGGVALGGIAAGCRGLNWIGVELEKDFAIIGTRNILLHIEKGRCTCGEDGEAYLRAVRRIVREKCGRGESEAEAQDRPLLREGVQKHVSQQGPKVDRGAEGEVEQSQAVEQRQAMVEGDASQTVSKGIGRLASYGKERELEGRACCPGGRLHQHQGQRKVETGASPPDGAALRQGVGGNGDCASQGRQQEKQRHFKPEPNNIVGSHETPQPARPEASGEARYVPNMRDGLRDDRDAEDGQGCLQIAFMQAATAARVWNAARCQAAWGSTCTACGKLILPLPILVQGDSRRFAEIVGPVCGVVSSPPYAATDTKPTALGSGRGTRIDGDSAGRNKGDYHYPDSDGQIGTLRAGSLDAVVTSPPYADSIKGEHAEQETAEESRSKRKTQGGPLGKSQRHGGYGGKENIGNLKEGTVDGIVTSSPYGGSNQNYKDGWKYIDQEKAVHNRRSSNQDAFYGDSPGQIGRESGETYWQAMHAVYGQMLQAMKPGAVAAIVVKDYVAKGKRVPLCDDTCRLLEHLGFTVFERSRCWLVKEHKQPGLFGVECVERTERKSFFRRLAEKKGSPRIDWEEVIWART